MKKLLSKEEIENQQELIDINDEGKSIEMDSYKLSIQRKKSFSFVINYKVFIILTLIILCILIFFIIKSVKIKNKKIKLIKVKDTNELNKIAGDIIIDIIKNNPGASIGLASGNTPKGVYKYLIEKYEDQEISFQNVTVFSLDELWDLEPTYIQSNNYFIRTNLLEHIDIKEKNIHLIKGSGDSSQKNINEYNQLLLKNPVDLQIISIGTDGHFGFIQPRESFDSKTHLVNLKIKTRKKLMKLFDNDITKTPTKAITQGIKNLLEAKNILIVANGKEKAEGIKNLVKSNYTIDKPLSAFQNHSGNIFVVADKDACSEL